MATNNSVYTFRRVAIFGCAALCLLLLTGCGSLSMRNQPRYDPLEQSQFFDDNQAARPLVPDTVAREHLQLDATFYTGQADGQPVESFPEAVAITKENLLRGEERYNIYCAPCHSRVGDGQGMIVQRGFRQPPSFHIDRLRQASPGYYYTVITNGFGVMPAYAHQIPPKDRWFIIAYIRALQLSQNAALEDAPPAEQQNLQGQ